ncbi:formyltransferase family protein [Halobacillus halophilus]|uniref:formyltransferase family protein n=1 Tax=Halobacillus halophilus TaxID=1570 RepID=UPI001CD37078|nr:formyltransferase family protein [Halobacillus halophilus]MCA1012695.1 hypothetical protein [Halobacillus halophilus]
MKVTVFTSNQPRHIAFIERLASICEEVYVVQECHSAFPGKEEGFYKKSEIMKEYFSYVLQAEAKVFGEIRFSPPNVRSIALKAGEVSLVDLTHLKDALHSDYYVVFGASFIKGELCDWLVSQKAINIHMGISPYYRGNSCNFWAMYDGRPDLVGATIHLLGKGLDSGEMLFHALPGRSLDYDPFILGMEAVKSAQCALIDSIQSGTVHKISPVIQNAQKEIKYTRNKDFTDAVAADYLSNLPSPAWVKKKIEQRDLSMFTNPVIQS